MITWTLITLAVVVGLVSVLRAVLGLAALGTRIISKQRKGAAQRHMETYQ